MAFTADHKLLLDRLDDDLTAASQPSAGLFAKLIGGACTRLPMLGRSKSRIAHLVEAEAWTECALALVASELPAFTLRRLVYDSGEWLCTLSRQPNLPIDFDDTVEARHEAQAVAILRALVEAKRQKRAPRWEPAPRLAPKESRGASGDAGAWGNLCCENFA